MRYGGGVVAVTVVVGADASACEKGERRRHWQVMKTRLVSLIITRRSSPVNYIMKDRSYFPIG